MSQPLSVVVAQFKKNRSQVAVEFDAPVLVWEATAASQQEAWEKTQVQAEGMPALGESQVFKLVKGSNSHNAFAMGITIGRVATNDIAVPHDTVSRFHAFFQKDKTGRWTITDAESKFGTWLNEQKLDPNKHVPLADACTLRIGEAKLHFMLPEQFMTWLATR